MEDREPHRQGEVARRRREVPRVRPGRSWAGLDELVDAVERYEEGDLRMEGE